MDYQQQIYLVEDDIDLRQMLSTFLSSEGFLVDSFCNGQQLYHAISVKQPDLVLLDYMLDNETGIEICKKVRLNFSGPIIMITAHNNDLLEVSSLNEGANGFLGKPLRPHVLLAHIKAHLREQPLASNPEQIVSGDLLIDRSSFNVSIADEIINLSDSEYSLLVFLAENAGQVISRDSIFSQVRGIEYDGLDRSIDMRISVLRNKLNDNAIPYKYIKTIRGKGYVFIMER